MTATLAPAGTSAVLRTAPTPVETQQPMSAATAGSTPVGERDRGRGGHDRRPGHRADRAVGQDRLRRPRWPGRSCRPGAGGGTTGSPGRPTAGRPDTTGRPRRAPARTGPPAARPGGAARPARPPRPPRRPRGPSRSASGAATPRRGRAGRSGRRPRRGSGRGPRRPVARPRSSVSTVTASPGVRSTAARVVVTSRPPGGVRRGGRGRTGRRPATTSRRRSARRHRCRRGPRPDRRRSPRGRRPPRSPG